MLTVSELLSDLDVRLLTGESATDVPVRWVHISEIEDPTPWLSGRRAAADDRHAARHRCRASARSSPGWPTTIWPDWGSGPASPTPKFRRRSCRPPLSVSSRCSRFPTTCRSSRSPRPRSRSWSTSSTRSCDGRWPLTNGSSGSFSQSAAWRRWPSTLSTQIGAAVLVCDARGKPLACKEFRRALEPEAIARLQSELYARRPRGARRSCPATAISPIARWRCRSPPTAAAMAARIAGRAGARGMAGRDQGFRAAV